MTVTGSVQGQARHHRQDGADGDQAAAHQGAVQHRRGRVCASGAGALLLLAGCSSLPSSVNPVSWWHDMQGGAVAQDRPPAPGATDPYPNLATVPSKPEQTDPKARAQVADALVADRANAHYAASQAPLPDPSSPTASPQLFGVGTAAPPPPASAASATLEAASAPPPPPTAAVGPTPSGQPLPAPTAPAPAAASAAGPSAATSAAVPPRPVPSGAAAPADPGTAAGRQPMAANDASAPLAPSPAFANNRPVPAENPASLPPLPAAPPDAPNLPGATPTVPRPVAAPKAPPGKPAAPVVHDPITVAFPPGSAELPLNYRAPLKVLADKRGKGSVIVVGYGEAARTDPHDQSVGLSLGLARAQAIAAALAAAGVPAGSIQVEAEAAGRGAAVRLVD